MSNESETTQAGDRLTDRLQQLPKSLDPQMDLWPGIESRLVPRVRARTGWGIALAASITAAIGFGLWNSNTSTQPGDTVDIVEQPSEPESGMAGMVLAANLDREFSAAIRGLADEMPEPEPNIGSATVHLGLRTLRHAGEEIRAALEQDPDSVYLADLLENTQRKQLQLLREMALNQERNT